MVVMSHTNTKRFVDQSFSSFLDQDSSALFSNLEFLRCSFISSTISHTSDPSLRSTVRNVRLIDCNVGGCGVESAIVEDTVIDGLTVNGLFQTFGAAFKHVVLKGKIDRVMITNDVLPDVTWPEKYRQEEIELFRAANAEYYKNVEWALDISQGEFKELDIRGVPGKLIRRDPTSQALVLRENALAADWRKLEFHDGSVRVGFGLLESGHNLSDYVIAAEKRSRRYRKTLADIEMLRSLGIAEPD